jgi:hypothetical protein
MIENAREARLRVSGIVLATLEVRCDELGWEHLHLMPERLQQERPMVRATAGLDADHRRRQLGEEGDHLLAPELLAQHRLLGGIHPVQLEDVF